jgi:hypothetical protein
VTEPTLRGDLDGAVIRKATFVDPYADEEWTDHDELTLHLADGRTVSVTSWGHDASGLILTIDDTRYESETP